jgi:drug/metabolite transporter (DMT)-like permease
MVTVAYTPAGIPQTLISLMSVIIIPVAWIIYREKTSCRDLLGAMVAAIELRIPTLKPQLC